MSSNPREKELFSVISDLSKKVHEDNVLAIEKYGKILSDEFHHDKNQIMSIMATTITRLMANWMATSIVMAVRDEELEALEYGDVSKLVLDAVDSCMLPLKEFNALKKVREQMLTIDDDEAMEALIAEFKANVQA